MSSHLGPLNGVDVGAKLEPCGRYLGLYWAEDGLL